MRLDLDFLTGNSQLYFPVKRGTLNILGGSPSIDLSASSGDTSLLVPSDNHLASVVGVYFPDDIKNYFYSIGAVPQILVSIRDSGHPDATTPVYSELLVCFLVNITGGINSAYKYLGFGQQQLAYVKQYSPQTTPVTPTAIIIYEISLQISNGEADPVNILGGSSTQTQNIHKFILGFYNTDNYCPLVNPSFWGGSSNFTVLSYNGTSGIAFNNIFYINDNIYNQSFGKGYTANTSQPFALSSVIGGSTTYPTHDANYILNVKYSGGTFFVYVNFKYVGGDQVSTNIQSGNFFDLILFINDLITLYPSTQQGIILLKLLKNRLVNYFYNFCPLSSTQGLMNAQDGNNVQVNYVISGDSNLFAFAQFASYPNLLSFTFNINI